MHIALSPAKYSSHGNTDLKCCKQTTFTRGIYRNMSASPSDRTHGPVSTVRQYCLLRKMSHCVKRYRGDAYCISFICIETVATNEKRRSQFHPTASGCLSRVYRLVGCRPRHVYRPVLWGLARHGTRSTALFCFIGVATKNFVGEERK